MPAFELAIQMAADGVELDVQRTADGQLVVIHDETIGRTSNGVGKVVDLTYEELRHVDFSNGFAGRRNTRIPLLREVLELFQPTNMVVNVELKNTRELYPGMESDVLAAIDDAGMRERVVISSFNHFSLVNLRDRVAPEQLGMLYSDGLYDPWRYAQVLGAGALHPNFLALQQPGYLWLAHEAGVKVHAWTVNNDEEAAALAGLGVDAIITDFPDRVGEAVRGPRFVL